MDPLSLYIASKIFGSVEDFKEMPKSCKYIKANKLQEFKSWLEGNDVSNIELREAAKSTNVEFIKLVLNETSFSDENINRALLTAMDQKNHSVIELLRQHPQYDATFSDNEHIRCASRVGLISIVKELMNDPKVNPADKDNCAVFLAAREGKLEIVKLLLSDNRVMNGELIKTLDTSLCNKRYDIVRYLLSLDKIKVTNMHIAHDVSDLDIAKLVVSHPTLEVNFETFEVALKADATKMIEVLLKHPNVDPSYAESKCVRLCVENGSLVTLSLLLTDKRINPAAKSNAALKKAVKCSSYVAVAHLIQDPRVVAEAKRCL